MIGRLPVFGVFVASEKRWITVEIWRAKFDWMAQNLMQRQNKKMCVIKMVQNSIMARDWNEPKRHWII